VEVNDSFNVWAPEPVWTTCRREIYSFLRPCRSPVTKPTEIRRLKCGEIWRFLFITLKFLLNKTRRHHQTKKTCNFKVRLKKSNEMQQYSDIYLLLTYSTCFGPHRAHHQEYKNCSCILWYRSYCKTVYVLVSS